MITIHPIGPDDWSAWRTIRLRALRETPDAFSSTYAKASESRDDEVYWRGYFTMNGQNYLASLDQDLVGLVRITGPNSHSDAQLTSLWVAPEARGQGIGTALVQACWNWLQATAPGRPLRLSVRRRNVTARRLYERLGFDLAAPDPEDSSEDLLIKRSAC